jgi:hypothetical protein
VIAEISLIADRPLRRFITAGFLLDKWLNEAREAAMANETVRSRSRDPRGRTLENWECEPL